MLSLLTINWNPDPELFNFFGISIRYYGLLWIIGLAFAYLIVQHQYRDRKIDEKEIRTSFLLLLLRHTDRRTTGPLHILRLGLLPRPLR